MKKDTSDKQRRKDYFIKKSFQAKFILGYLIIMVVSSILMVYFLHRHLMAKLSFTMFAGHSTIDNTWEIFRLPVLETTIAIVIVTIFMILLLTVMIALFIDRRCRQIAEITRQIRMDETEVPAIPKWPGEFQEISMAILSIKKDQNARNKMVASQINLMKETVEDALTALSGGKELRSYVENLLFLEKELKKLSRPGEMSRK